MTITNADDPRMDDLMRDTLEEIKTAAKDIINDACTAFNGDPALEATFAEYVWDDVRDLTVSEVMARKKSKVENPPPSPLFEMCAGIARAHVEMLGGAR